MVLLIDNYDSFTYNLVQYFGELGCAITVFRNDSITLEEIKKIRPSAIVISPGPGGPQDAGVSCSVIKGFAGKLPILGVCLGHQCIAHVFEGKVVRAKRLMHGKTSMVYHDGKAIFKGIENPFCATRYHSLIVENKGLPEWLVVTARTRDNEIMGLRHRDLQVYGVQFHPESIMTGSGKKMLKNFLDLRKK